MSHVLPIAAIALLGPVLWLTSRWNRSVESVPSIFWALTAVLPFIYLRPSLPAWAAEQQSIGIAIVALALAAADIVASANPAPSIGYLDESNPRIGQFTLVAAALLAGFVILIPIVHLSFEFNLPLVTRILHPSLSGEELTTERERFSKLLDAPAWLKLMFNWVIVIAGPILVLILLGLRKWFSAIAVLVWVGLYAALPLAKLPPLAFTLCCLIGFFWDAKHQRVFIATVLVLSMVGNGLGIVRGEALRAWYEGMDRTLIPLSERQRLEQSEIPLSVGDIDRIQEPGTELMAPSTLGADLDVYVYRAALVPMEVSNRWYMFFPGVSGGYRGIDDILFWRRPGNWVHPATAVAAWAYAERFPKRYLPSARAYASIDADAYAHGGLWIVMLVSILFAAIRAALGWIRTPDLIGSSVYGVSLALFSFLPFQASLQALLVAQGAGLCLAILVIWRLIRLWLHSRASSSISTSCRPATDA
jgi:hypothetical protein